MNPTQKRALLAIITMLEQGLAQLKGLVLTPEEAAVPIKAPHPFPSAVTEYLSEDEEDRLADLMEKSRSEAAHRESQMRDLFRDEDGLDG